MRALAVLEMLFNEIAEFTETKARHLRAINGQNINVLFLEKEQAIIGFLKQKSRLGINGFLRIWPFCFSKDFKPESFCINFDSPCDLQITAGPFWGEKQDPQRGRDIIEDIEVQFGVCVELSVYGPFFLLVAHILSVLATMQNEYLLPKKLTYWEAYLLSGA